MPNDLPVPPELQHLLEKRENETDRRAKDRRQCESTGADSVQPLAEAFDRRTGQRRTEKRREGDA